MEEVIFTGTSTYIISLRRLFFGTQIKRYQYFRANQATGERFGTSNALFFAQGLEPEGDHVHE
jgi:hypothetical protein